MADVPSFLLKLWQMLQDVSNAHVISWNPDGTMFRVRSPAMMGNLVLGKYFRHNNFASFQRQLNYFGFHKCGKDDSGCYYRHALFVRHAPKQLALIQRKTNHSATAAALVPGASARSRGAAASSSSASSSSSSLPPPPSAAVAVAAAASAHPRARTARRGAAAAAQAPCAVPSPTQATADASAQPRENAAGRFGKRGRGGFSIGYTPPSALDSSNALGILGYAASVDLVKRQRLHHRD